MRKGVLVAAAWVLLALLLGFLFMVVIPGRGDDEREVDPAAANPPSFEDVPWLLAGGIDVPGWERVAPSATFAGGRATGSTGCNRFNAPYTLDGSALRLGDVATTRMACEPPGDAVERAFVDALGRVATAREADGELVLLDAGGAELLRFREPSPAGAWVATAFLQADAVSSPIAGTEVTATFDDAGELTGSAGCNSYSATYTADRGTIEIGAPAATEMACPKPAGVMEQEQAFLAALPRAASYRLDGATLTLLTAGDTIVATFERG